jgi:hypothetical protein
MRNENDNRKIRRIMTFGNVFLTILLSFVASLILIAVAYRFVPRFDNTPPIVYPTVFRRVWMECEFASSKKLLGSTEYVNCRPIEARYRTTDEP